MLQRWCRCRRRFAVAVTSNTDSARCTSRNRRQTTASTASCRIRRRSTWATTARCTTWRQPIRSQHRRTVITRWFQPCRSLIRRRCRRPPPVLLLVRIPYEVCKVVSCPVVIALFRQYYEGSHGSWKVRKFEFGFFRTWKVLKLDRGAEKVLNLASVFLKTCVGSCRFCSC